MSASTRLLGSLGALGGALGIAAGAVGAHVLHLQAGTREAHLFDTAVSYLLVHAVLVVSLAVVTRTPGWRAVMGLMLLGMICFSGGLLVQVAAERPVPVIPFGGMCLIAGWLVAAALCARRPSTLN